MSNKKETSITKCEICFLFVKTKKLLLINGISILKMSTFVLAKIQNCSTNGAVFI